jgi:proline dehydrogenase
VRQVLIRASHSSRIRGLVETVPPARALVARYVPGVAAEDAVAACSRLATAGLLASLDHLGEDTTDLAQARATRDAYRQVLRLLADAGLVGPDSPAAAEVSVKLSAVGQALGRDGDKIALEHARDICVAATEVGTTVTLDMEDHTTTDSTLAVLRELRADFPAVGAVLQAYLRRSEADCRDLATEGSRVRLCKGAYDEPSSVAFRDRTEVDLSYVRCLKVLMAGPGYPMVATHDPRLVDIASVLAARSERAPGSYEFQMLYGVRPDEQVRLAGQGETVRVYLPYGEQWYGYLMRRLAERPANLTFFLRSLVSRG